MIFIKVSKVSVIQIVKDLHVVSQEGVREAGVGWGGDWWHRTL